MLKKILDISEYQSKLDFKLVKKNYDGVIIRVGYGNNEVEQDDKCAVDFIKKCKKYSIPYGVYIYSYAYNYEMLLSEVEHTKRVIDSVDYEPSLPIFIDLEENNDRFIKYLNTSISLWHDEILKFGWLPGVYSGAYWYKNYIKEIPNDMVKWVAQYNSVCEIQEYDIWQFSDNENVGGVKCDVSIMDCENEIYKELNHMIYLLRTRYSGIRTNINQAIKLYWTSADCKKCKDFVERLYTCLKIHIKNISK